MAMTNQRKGEIAYALLKVHLRKVGMRYDIIRREAGTVSKETGVLAEDLIEFAELLNLEVHGEIFEELKKSQKRRSGIPKPGGAFNAPKK